jgi:hypothetical protein
LEESEFWETLGRIYEALSMMELVNRYKSIVMKNEDLTLVTYFEYVKE